MKHYFVVRGAKAGKQHFAIEVDRHRQTLHQLRKPKEHGEAIAYLCEVPETMTLREAIHLYKSGMRAKPPKADPTGKLILADVLQDKRRKREEARRGP